jgi:DeoR/GlpR family transcriptional regulator of sugar metabolism
VETLEKNNFQLSIVPMTKDRLSKLQKQLSHMSPYAFNQMMDIPRPDKRDFKVYYKIIKKTRQIITVYPHRKSHQSLFAQVVQYDEQNNVNSIKHCSFDNNSPYILNESKIDKFGNLRQIAHVGKKGGGIAQNSVERFDDGTLIWVITQEKETGAAALKPNDEVVFVGNVINNAAKLAARNMGAEVVIGNTWGGRFCPSGCRPECHPMQQHFKSQVRLQINQIIDGATIPGLDPIFKINPPF